MAVTAESLVQPRGPIDPSFFPDDEPPPATGPGTLLDRLATYINRGQDKIAGLTVSDADTAVANWALHLAFEDAYTLMAARPANENFMGGLGGYGYNTEQLKAFKRKAEEYALGYTQVVLATPATMPTSHTSRVSRINFEW